MEHSACLKMKVETLRGLLNDRLTAVVEEICGLFLITIAELEETRPRSNVAWPQQERPQVPSPALSDGGRLRHGETESVLAIKQEQQQKRFILDQKAGEPLYIKKEMEDPGSILEEQCVEQPNYPFILTDIQQATTTNQSFSKQQEQRSIRKDKTPRPPHCNEDQETRGTLSGYVKGAEENINSECPSSSSSSAQQMEVDGENCDTAALGSGSGKTSNSSEYDTEDSDDDIWNRTPAYQSSLKNDLGSEPNKLDLKAVTDLEPDSSEPETEDSDDEDRHCSGKRPSGLTTVEPAEVPESPSKSSCQTSLSLSIHSESDQLKQQVGNKTRSQKAPLTQSKLCLAANLSEPSSAQTKLNSPASRKSNRSTSLKKDRTKKLEEKLFRCSVCGQTFEKNAYFLLHMKAHKAERRRKTAHSGGSS
ncbi:uncharacterized protein LOC114857170 isoform X1 [Betta splendens]|uniref:Uncharacterized protein LOC114857170 isoform X1 n=1 Tax=Betta splendens TaxID=158456 RepID=A0A6P7MU14_BETSP|nr:uncharacterized protein LOC114857170 isoform X1 [Betta splendens]